MIRKVLSLCLVLALALGCAGALAEDDLQAQLDAANAKIAELQEQVDTYYPYYIAQIVATYGEDGIIWLDDVQAQYDAVNAQYQNMGISLESYGMADTVKKDLVDSAVEDAVLLAKAEELGLDQLDEEAQAKVETDAQAAMDQYVDYYISYFHADEDVTDEMREEAQQYWTDNGMTLDSIIESMTRTAVLNAVEDYATKDVAVTEEDVQAAYDALVAANQEDYADDRAYNSDRDTGVAIAWNPEGYRAVKHVLIQFSDEQAQKYADLQDQLDSLQQERENIENPPEPTEAPEATEAAEEAAEDATPEPTELPAPRSLDAVDEDIAACGMEIEALYSELMPAAEEVIAAFNHGTSFDELIAQYNSDPGMQNEPTASQGYAVSANSTTWEQAFTDGAMAIENVGEISKPVYGSNGIHIIYYLADITPGPVDLEEIRDSITQDAEEQKHTDAFNAQVDAWVEEANVEYHYDSFGITT